MIQSGLSDIRLEDATIIVPGRGGLGGPEGFQDLQSLAETTGRDSRCFKGSV
jgi:electron transfer flavoprotein alpha subunit